MAALLAVLGGGVPAVAEEKGTTRLKTIVRDFRIDTAAEFLGSASGRTVVRIRLSSIDIARAVSGKGVHQYSMALRGQIRDAAGAAVEILQYPFSGAIAKDTPITFSFLRALPPGKYEVEIDLGDGKKTYGKAKFPLDVPLVAQAFRPEMAPADYSTLPTAEAVLLAAPPEAAAKPAVAAATSAVPKVKIVPPERETPIGLMRLEAVVFPPVEKVEFYLDDKLLLARTRPPYTVEIDLGKVPRRQTVRAVGYDSTGAVVDEDAWALNEGDARVAVRILPIPSRQPADGVRVRVAVQSINGGVAKTVDLFLDDRKVSTFTHPPYEAVVPAAEYAGALYLRATAVTAEGVEANDIRFLKGPGATMENVRVDVVQLHVSALDGMGKFVPDLQAGEFSVSEDGRAQTIQSFEVARNLPLNVGLIIDASGSMRKAMPFVHEAGTLLFRDMIHEKDRGFVIQFRETPSLLAAPTGNVDQLTAAIARAEATGQTALYDSIVLGLYQFRGTTGRKALVVVSDGGDNHSWVDYATMLRYVRSSGVPIYVIGVDIGFTDFGVKKKLSEIAADTGGEAFYTTNAAKIQEIVTRIEAELRSQYVLAYRTDSARPEGQFREIKVAVKRPDVRLRTLRGYVP